MNEDIAHPQQEGTSSAEKLAVLCFASDGNSFQGRLLSKEDNSKQYALMGKKTKAPKTAFHQCCFEDEPLFYHITFIDFARNREYVINHVMKTNGDNCSLTSDELSFDTDDLLVGAKAERMIRSYFSEKLLNRDCHVCTGQMRIQGVLNKQMFDDVKDEGDDSDSDF